MKVWDGLVRLLHWTLVAAVAAAWLSTLGWGFVRFHEIAGYVAFGVVAIRLVWGFTGSRFARFSEFVRGAGSVLRYTRQLRTNKEPRYIGHNPLGGWMVLALLACVASLGLTGWLYTTDAFWGEAWLDRLHYALAWALLGLIGLHVTGVVFTSLRHRENLILAMFTGHKNPPTRNEHRPPLL
jgi:cytochrome b